jgi:hypothetical protein
VLIESVTVSLPVGALDPVGIILPGPHAFHPDVPDITGPVMVRIELDRCYGVVVGGAAKKEEKDFYGIPAK